MPCKIAVVDENPSSMDPVSTKMVYSILKQLKIDYDDVYFTKVMKVEPRGGYFGSWYDKKEKGKKRSELANDALRAGRARLVDELRREAPNVVIAMGNNSLETISGWERTGIDKWRGSVWTSPEGFKVVATYRPEQIIKGGRTSKGTPVRPVMVMDFLKALKESKSKEFKPIDRARIINPKLKDITEFLETVEKNSLPISVDIETEAGLISCIGFAISPACSFCIPFVNGDGAMWSKEDERYIWEKIKHLLENENVRKIGQNFAYDMTWLEGKRGIFTKGYDFDTIVGMHVMYPEFPLSLAFQTSIFTDMPYFKEAGKMHKTAKIYEDLWKYNCNDVLATFECFMALGKEIEKRDQFKQFKFSMDVYKIMHRISRRGIAFDTSLRTQMKKDSKIELTRLEEEFERLVGQTINMSSPAQLKKYYQDDMGYKLYINRKTKKPTLDENALKKMAAKFPMDKSLVTLATHRKKKKLHGTYLNVKIDDDKRIRCSYGLAETGRLRSSSNPFWTGTNLQNIPKSMRCLFIPDPGHVFIEADLGQADARVVAYDSGDEAYIAIFESGKDIHRQNAANIFGLSLSEVSDRERQLGKKISHATNYGVGARTMCDSIIKELGIDYAISEREAKLFQQKYHEAYPGVKRWQGRLATEMRASRTLTTCFGRRRYFMGPPGDPLNKEAFAWRPQSVVADLINKGILAWEDPERPPILLQVHDSVLMQVEKGSLEELYKLVKEIEKYFEIPITIGGREIIIPIEVSVGHNWGDMKEVP